MFLTWAKKWFGELNKKDKYVLLTGFDHVGKSNLLQKLTEKEITINPMGTEIAGTKTKNLRILTWGEGGGRNPLRPLLQNIYPSMDAVIFVVDSQDKVHLEWGVRYKVQDLLAEEELQDVQFLVVANKQDLPGALTCQEMRDMLSLSKDQDQRVEIVATSLVTGQGLPEVRDWIDRQHARRQLQRAVVQPLEKAVPPTLKSTFSRMSSALKQAFGTAKNKPPPVA